LVGGGQDLGAASFDAPVAAVLGAVRDRDLRPGQRVEAGEQSTRVVFDRSEHVGRLLVFDQVAGGVTLNVQSIQGDDPTA